MAEKKKTVQVKANTSSKPTKKATSKTTSKKTSKKEVKVDEKTVKKVEKKAAKKPTKAQLKKVNDLIGTLSDASRRARQDASHELAELAHIAPLAFEEHVDALIDALYRPEAQTRWEILDVLASLSVHFGDAVFKAFDAAEASLFDTDSATVRLASFLFLCQYGATSAKHSDEAWPLLDEAVQCYHGDAEYHDMLQGLLTLAHGDISKDVKKALSNRMKFDAENATGYIKQYSEEIISALK
ncbi:MAG: hypothetical protein HXK61_02865 [Atopobiaceae bacterium]|nr:hypothetical protein [Atopobiaceae bacterium]